MKSLIFLGLALAAAFPIVQSQQCSGDEFTCKNGECIPAQYKCDGEDQCGDLSDEFECACGEDDFLCANGECIQDSYRCDNYNDCKDGSDELNCTCDGFRCISDGRCLPIRNKCDGFEHCVDGSDEVDCPTPSTTTIAPCFNCADGSECIPAYDVCNGWSECADDSDELPCPCEDDELKCDNGRCIHESLWCNEFGIEHCSDGSDQANCDNVTPSIALKSRHPRGLTILSKKAREGKIRKAKHLRRMMMMTQIRKLKK